MEIWLFLIRLAVLASLYLFLAAIFLVIWREFRFATRGRAEELEPPPGRLLVLEAGDTELAAGDMLSLEGHTSIGRSPVNTIVLLDSSVSATHALLTYANGCWWLQDQGSTNGTVLNGLLIEGRLPLRRADVIGLGQVRLRLEDV
jgi:hypothetical protein